MLNILSELLRHTHDKPPLKCAEIILAPMEEEEKVFLLPSNFTDTAFALFTAALSEIEYDDGYGHQELFGTLWYMDGSWSSRHEYDGLEWWEYNKAPDIPSHLL